MKQTTIDAFNVALDAMKKDAKRRIGGFKRRKGLTPTQLSRSIRSEQEFFDSCDRLQRIISCELYKGKLPVTFLRKDQHCRDIMKNNLEYILGRGHSEIPNIIDLVFGKVTTAKIVNIDNIKVY